MNKVYSGYDITLNKLENRAYKGKMLGIEGNSYQETREGYNYFDAGNLKLTNTTQMSQSWENDILTVTSAGLPFALASQNITDLVKNNPGQTLTFDFEKITFTQVDVTKSSPIQMNIYFSDGTANKYWSIVDYQKIKHPYTIPTDTSNISSVLICVYSWNGTGNDSEFTTTVKKPMLYLGAEEKEYERYGKTPSIEHEAPIESVGDNINLCDNQFRQGSYNLLNNKIRLFTTQNYKVEAGKTYTLATNLDFKTYKYSIGLAVSEFPEVAQSDLYYDSGWLEKAETTFTSEQDGYFGIGITRQNASEIVPEDMKDFYFKLVEGTSTGAYSPYGQGSIEIYNCNKNILDVEKLTTNAINGGIAINSDGNVYDNTPTADSRAWTYNNSNWQMLLDKGTYTVSLDFHTKCTDTNGSIRILDENNNNVNLKSIVNVSATTMSFELTERINIGVMLKIFDGVCSIQIEKGNTATEHIQHQSQTKVLYTQQPFRAIGDVKDRFVKVDGVWYEEHNIDEYIFTGNEGWKKSSRTDVNRYYISNIINTILNASTVDILCSHFKALTSSQSDTGMIGISKYNETGLMVNVDLTNTELDTLDKFKAKLTELYNAGTPLYVDYILATPTLIPCTPQQSTILDQLENIQLYDGINYIYTTDGIEPLLTLEIYNMIEDYDLYVSNDGYFGIPGTDIKFLVNFYESNLPTMPEAVEASVRAAGRDGDYVLNTTYEPLPFEIVCYTEDNLTVTQKREIESKVNRFLNSIKNRTKRIAFEKGEKFYNVKYNGLLTTTNYPAHLKFSIPLKSSESFGKDAYQKVLSGNSTEVSDTVEEVGALITIYGPATLPIIALNDYSMEYDTAILEGARVEIDTAKSTATHINSDGVKTNVMRYYNHQFPKIQPGENTLKVLSGVDDENNVTVKWNDLKL